MKKIATIIFILAARVGFSQSIDSLRVSPNPFNVDTYIYYELSNNDTVSINIYSMLGQTVKTVMKDSLINSGYYSFHFYSDSLVDGIYFVSLKLGNHKTINKKMLKNSAISILESKLFKTNVKPYPNPTCNSITISIDKMKKVVITDVNGKICKEIATDDAVISLAGLKAATYFINVFSADNKLLMVEKIIKLE